MRSTPNRSRHSALCPARWLAHWSEKSETGEARSADAAGGVSRLDRPTESSWSTPPLVGRLRVRRATGGHRDFAPLRLAQSPAFQPRDGCEPLILAAAPRATGIYGPRRSFEGRLYDLTLMSRAPRREQQTVSDLRV